MFQFFRNKSHKVGAPPGTLTYVGPDKAFAPRVNVVSYGPDGLAETTCDPGAPRPDLSGWPVNLINVTGVHDTDTVKAVGQWFDLHPLVLEDILNTSQRPKIEEPDDGSLFIVVKDLEFQADSGRVNIEQVGLVWGPDFVLTFQESEHALFEPVIQRIRKGRGRMRSSGPDYLVIALLDAVVDRYYLTLSRLGERVEGLEAALLGKDLGDETLFDIYALKRETLSLRNVLWPVQEVLNQLIKEEVGTVQEASLPFLRDVHGHAAEVVDAVDTLHDILSGMLNVYISLAGMRMNNIMKFLTIIATVFIPLTFVAGVYGMNFEYMPELSWRWGYPAVLGGMCALAAGMAVYFSRKKWF
ncbi:MAG: magnesium/cobalt transporter CorA [Desulfovibrionaceae bacterium]|nr:magnesium/cobalt transporter CorA [Desulfovibrionaceae bacterium]MDD4952890.1 magnesium/cobalt transporter CorA [Desulfovibrionaceae bacterium]